MSEPSKIMIAGDWHGNGGWAQMCIHHARKMGADTIMHVGDFGWWSLIEPGTVKYLRLLQRTLEECGITLYWVDGNHENHDDIQEWVDIFEGAAWSSTKYPNIIHMPRGHRWEWWGQTWLALGGAHSVDRLMRTEGKSWWDGEHISEAEIERAISGGPADVMVTHDCPAGVIIPGIHPDLTINAIQSGFPSSEIIASHNHRQLLQRVVDAVKPSVLFHGHYHVRYSSLYRDPGFVTNVFGLAEDGTSLEANTLLLHRNAA